MATMEWHSNIVLPLRPSPRMKPPPPHRSTTRVLKCALFCHSAGGHLNPAVTFSTLICGFYPVLHSLLYIALQVRHGSAAMLPGLQPRLESDCRTCWALERHEH
jgi:hypothetical protein